MLKRLFILMTFACHFSAFLTGCAQQAKHRAAIEAPSSQYEVRATEAGVVSATGLEIDKNFIVIDNANGTQSRYVGMAEIMVAVGEKIEKGMKIGTLSWENRFLHVEVTKNNETISTSVRKVYF